MQLKILRGVKVVSWDVDGTLYHSQKMRRRLFWLWMRSYWKKTTRQDVRTILKFQSLAEAARRHNGELTIAVAERRKIEEIESRWFAPAIRNTGPRPSIDNLTKQLAARGFKQIIISDFRCRYKLEALSLSPNFQHVFHGEDFGWLKPSPNVFFEACKVLGIQPKQLLHIGDRPETDGAAASAAGCRHIIIGQRSFRSLADAFL